jgi:protein ImuB
MLRRLLALWLPRFATDRLVRRRAAHAPAADLRRPLAVTADDRGRLRLAAVNRAAELAGLRPGMALADARAIEPGLAAAPADPAGDAEALEALADWCGRYTPWTAVDGGDGIVLDVTGCAHLFGGEAGLLRDLVGRLRTIGYESRAAIADGAAAARAVAATGPGYGAPGDPLGDAIVAPGRSGAALAGLPVAGLRLDAGTVADLARLGLRRIGDLYDLPRESLAARFGPGLTERLDRALAREPEPISPRRPLPPHLARLLFAEPIGRTEDVRAALDHLLETLCDGLERAQRGARRLELALYRTDGTAQRLAVGTSRPSRRPAHLRQLFAEAYDRMDAGFGIDAATLGAAATEPLGAEQLALADGGAAATPLADLIDRLGSRLGLAAISRPVPRESHRPERAVAAAPPLAPTGSRPARWPDDPPRPVRLFVPPRPVEAVAPAPDDPPLLFRRHGRVHRVARADGPERLSPEWWRAVPGDPGDDGEDRDYYRVEDLEGRRFWLFRAGRVRPDEPVRWFLHGSFA